MSEAFDKEFATLRELGEQVFVLRGSTIIVQILEDEELKTQGGLIIATPSNHGRNSIAEHRLQVARVLMTGQGYWDDDSKSFQKLDVEPGAIIILPQFASQFISIFPGVQRPTGNKLALVKENEILAYYPTAEAYEKAKQKLN